MKLRMGFSIKQWLASSEESEKHERLYLVRADADYVAWR